MCQCLAQLKMKNAAPSETVANYEKKVKANVFIWQNEVIWFFIKKNKKKRNYFITTIMLFCLKNHLIFVTLLLHKYLMLINVLQIKYPVSNN